MTEGFDEQENRPGDRNERGGREERGGHPPRGRDDHPSGDRPRGDRGSRPPRDRGEREGRPSGNRNDRNERGGRPPRDHSDRPSGDRPRSDRSGRPPRDHSDRGGRPSKGRGGRDRDADNAAPRSARPLSPARIAALDVVRTLRERDAFAQDVIATRIDASRMSTEDRAFATRLVLGVVSARGTLDDIINRALRSPDDIRDDIRDVLRLGAYEIVFLDKAPHAAVDQGVELARSIAPRASGLANTALRKIVALKDEFPFGDVETDFEAFARSYAFPTWLAQRLVDDLGLPAARSFMAASNEPAPLFVAMNAARVSAEDEERVCTVLQECHGEPEPVVVGGMAVQGCYRTSGGRVLLDRRVRELLDEGRLFVSDAASQAVAQAVLPATKPASFLEIGAGRGTKTLLLQGQALRRFGAQIADYATLDNHEFKTRLLSERAQSFGIDVAEACTGDATALDEAFPGRLFDAVFIDAPCSGLGTLRRHPEIRWRLCEEDMSKMAAQGLAMLVSAAAHVAPGGTLAYATCTVSREENGGVVKGFLSSAAGSAFQLVPTNGKACFATLLEPGAPDSHFAVTMVRKA